MKNGLLNWWLYRKKALILYADNEDMSNFRPDGWVCPDTPSLPKAPTEGWGHWVPDWRDAVSDLVARRQHIFRNRMLVSRNHRCFECGKEFSKYATLDERGWCKECVREYNQVVKIRRMHERGLL